MVDRTHIEAMITDALTGGDVSDQRLAAVARILSGREVGHDWKGGFTLDASKRTPAPTDAKGFGTWTRTVERMPSDDQAYLTFPWRSDCGHFYHVDRCGQHQVPPFDTSSFLVFPRHPADGGPGAVVRGRGEAGTWRDLETDPPERGHIVLYPALDGEARGFSPYTASTADHGTTASEIERGYTSWLAFDAHPDDDAEEIVRLDIIESDGRRQASWHGGFCHGIESVAAHLSENGHAEAAAAVLEEWKGYVDAGPVAEDDVYGGGVAVLTLVRSESGEPLVRQVSCVDDGMAVLRHVPSAERGEEALVRRSPGKRVPLSRCHAFDGAVKARLLRGPGTWAERWEAETASGALRPLVAA